MPQTHGEENSVQCLHGMRPKDTTMFAEPSWTGILKFYSGSVQQEWKFLDREKFEFR